MFESGPVLFALLAIVSSYLLLRSARRRTARRSGDERLATPPAPVDRGHHLAAPREFRQWEVEMHEIARELSGQLDSKIVLLEHLIRTAQQESARLEDLLQRVEPALSASREAD